MLKLGRTGTTKKGVSELGARDEERGIYELGARGHLPAHTRYEMYLNEQNRWKGGTDGLVAMGANKSVLTWSGTALKNYIIT